MQSSAIYKILSWLFPNIIWSNPQKSSKIYLTFDDGPHPLYTLAILNILKHFNVRATFFLIGKYVKLYPEIVQQISDDGHIIGIHSYSHQKLIFKSKKKMIFELLETQKVIKKITNRVPKLFRPPYGYFTPKLLRVCHKLKLLIVMWTFMPYDFDIKKSESQIIRTTISRLKKGMIIVLHDGHLHSYRTIKLLPKLIAGILEKKFQLEQLQG